MADLTRPRCALALGLGAVFSVLNVISAYIAPLADDTLFALAAFYGPMFVAGASPVSRPPGAPGGSPTG